MLLLCDGEIDLVDRHFLLIFKYQYVDRGINGRREELFRREAKVVIQGLNNVELEVFHENWMNDERE